MKFIIYFLIINLFSLIFLSCDTTEPVEDKPGRRDYVWTVDTLKTPNNPLGKLWASSPSDIWRTSDGSWDQSISHFDGKSWSFYGVSGMITPFAIYGFSSNNIFIGGAGSGQIWRFDGNNWSQFAQLTKDGHSNIVFEDMWGESPNNFYVVGGYGDNDGTFNKSVIASFNNGNWNMINTNGIKGIVEHLYKNETDNKIYLQAIHIGNETTLDSTVIYEFEGGKFYHLYSNVWTKGLQADISLINGEVYFVLGNKIAIRVNNQFQTILTVDNPNFYQRIWGRNSKNIFLLMTDGLAHYDGSDIEYLFYFNKVPRTQIYGAALFQYDVFFLVYEDQTNLNLIYHGILK